MKDFMEHIFPIMENKSPENQPFLECASELLYSQLDASRSFLIKEYKKNILDIFNGNVRIIFLFNLFYFRTSSSVPNKLLNTGARSLIGL